jgi:Leucine carboxyl methyltransferase
MHSSRTRLFSKTVRQCWFRPIAKLIERITIPGILLHYALRKKCIRELVRSALANGIAQVVILGAGFDPLSSELQGEFPTARFWEIDHPATPRPDLPNFLAQATDLLRSNRTTVIYGTVRLIEKDDESFLAWAKESYACIIFNLLTLHTPSGIEASARSLRGLIDLAIARGGS